MSRLNSTSSSTFRPGVQHVTGDSLSSQNKEVNKATTTQRPVPVSTDGSFAGASASSASSTPPTSLTFGDFPAAAIAFPTNVSYVEDFNIYNEMLEGEEAVQAVADLIAQETASAQNPILPQRPVPVSTDGSFAGASASSASSNTPHSTQSCGVHLQSRPRPQPQSQSHNSKPSHSTKSCEGKPCDASVCGPCLRLYCHYSGIQKDIIANVKRDIKDIGVDAAREKYTVDVCLKCRSSSYIVDSACENKGCEKSEVYRICAIGHMQFKNGTLLAQNNVLGDKRLLLTRFSPESWHLIYQESKKGAVKEMFDALFKLIAKGRVHDQCILVNSDHVISNMISHIAVSEYKNVTPSFCGSHKSANAAWILLRLRGVPLDVSIWVDAFEFQLDRDQILADCEEKIKEGKEAFEKIQRKIYQRVDIAGYLCDMFTNFISSCASARCATRNSDKLDTLTQGIVPDLISSIVEASSEYQNEQIDASAGIKDICAFVIKHREMSCTMFHIIKRFWRYIVLYIHPDKGGSSDFDNCNCLYKQLEKFLVADTSAELDKFRRSVVVVSRTSKEVTLLLEAAKSAPREYANAAATRDNTTTTSQEVIVFEEACSALVASGTINESIASVLSSLRETVPEQVNQLVQICVPAAKYNGSAITTVLDTAVIETGKSLTVTANEETAITASYVFEEVPSAIDIEFPTLGSTCEDVAVTLSSLNELELVNYNEYIQVRTAEKATETKEEMMQEDKSLGNTSSNYQQAADLTRDENGRKLMTADIKHRIRDTISRMYQIIYFDSNVSISDRKEMLALFGRKMVGCTPKEFMSFAKEHCSDLSAFQVRNLFDKVSSLVGAEKRKRILDAVNLAKSIAGQQAKKQRELEQENKSFEPSPIQVTKTSNICAQPDFFGEHDSHRAAEVARERAIDLSMRQYGLAWIRTLKRDEDTGKYVITDILTGVTSIIPEDLLIDVYSSAKVKVDGKFNGRHKSHRIPPAALLKRIEDREIPEGFYLRPMVLRYNSNKQIEEIDAGTSDSTEKNIRYLRKKMVLASVYAEDIDELDASFECGKGEYVANFCARRASSTELSRERAARKRRALEEKTRIIVNLQETKEVQYEDEITGELKDRVVMVHYQEVEKIIPTGSNNFYKMMINPAHGTASNGRVKL